MSSNNPDADDKELKENMNLDFEAFDKYNVTPQKKNGLGSSDASEKSYCSPPPFKISSIVDLNSEMKADIGDDTQRKAFMNQINPIKKFNLEEHQKRQSKPGKVGPPKRKHDNSKAMNIKKLGGKDTSEKFIDSLKSQQ